MDLNKNGGHPTLTLLPSSDDASEVDCWLALRLGLPSPVVDHCPHSFTHSSPLPTTPFQSESFLKLGIPTASQDDSRMAESSVSEHVPDYCDFKLAETVFGDEGSPSSDWSDGNMSHRLSLSPRTDADEESHDGQSHFSPEPSVTTEYSVHSFSFSANITAGISSRGNHPKKCKFLGCCKGARGSTGLCISHGGGQRCQKLGCNKGAESRTAYCKAHGGGRRCQYLGCTKSAEGKTDLCIAHGGGRRCRHPGGCNKAARGKSWLCIKHGGGKRCKIEGCTRSAEGQAGLCISHGGGRRCQRQGCCKGAQGSTMFCKAHGGGRRCVFSGCTKGAEGSTCLCKGHGGGKRCLYSGGGICPKSVHGGTSYCVLHGGGKRCTVSGCTKSARGRTDCCVRHGGGKRCRVDKCGKSAQGSTDFCKAHGGGKRCTWGGGRCEKFARGRSGLCAAHMGANTPQGQRCGEGGIGIAHPHLFDISSSSSSLVFFSDTSTIGCGGQKSEKSRVEVVIPEGRVHGGGLMSLLGWGGA